MDQNQRNGEEIVSENQIVEDDDDDEWVEGKRCVLSDPALPHYLSRRNGYTTTQKCISCGQRGGGAPDSDKLFHFYCGICQVEFHPECHKYPSKIIHPYHPQHPLTFTFIDRKKERIVATNSREYHFNYYRIRKFHKNFETLSNSNVIFDKCTWCADDLGQWFYRCSVCNFSLDFNCILQRPPLTIPNPKNHHHSLSLFPRPASFPCNACGLIDARQPSYACYQCNYVVHRFCIGLPCVIKITRHSHRLSFTPYLPTKVSSCRVCYKNVDIKYGQYSCDRGDCSFVVHSKCATHGRVWDGVELEWEPEEPEDIVPPYKKVGGGLIQHFGHDHHYLKLEKYNRTRDSGKQCQACMRSIWSSPEDFYNCIECEYFLHDVCANLPRKLDHGLHNHSLFLDPCLPRQLDSKNMHCLTCGRETSCWKYKCKKQECDRETTSVGS